MIRRINDRDIFTTADVADELAGHKSGDEILITVMRQGEVILIPVTLGDKPAHLR